MPYPAMRLIPLLVLCALSGCSLFGEDYTDLAPGTFRMKADGKEFNGDATYHPNFDSEFSEALIFMKTSSDGELGISSDSFNGASPGDRIEPSSASYRPLAGEVFTRRSGSVEIVYADSSHIEGTFSFRMKDVAMGCLVCREITVSGGFNATLEE